jgi:putative transposase
LVEKKIVDEFTVSERREKIDFSPKSPCVTRQVQLLGFSSSAYYYKPKPYKQQQIEIMNTIDKIHTDNPSYGTRRMQELLKKRGFLLGRKRIAKLFLRMNIRIQYPKKRTTIPNSEHRIYPYLLKKLKIERVNQVWQADITYIPMKRGNMFLMAIIDVRSRFVLNWSISNTMDKRWCCEVLKETIVQHGVPEICNTDQGSQFTSIDFTNILKEYEIQISMNGKGRATDNAYIERLWRSVKHEDIYKNVYENGADLFAGLTKYFKKYNTQRPHQSLENRYPMDVYKQVS